MRGRGFGYAFLQRGAALAAQLDEHVDQLLRHGSGREWRAVLARARKLTTTNVGCWEYEVAQRVLAVAFRRRKVRGHERAQANRRRREQELQP